MKINEQLRFVLDNLINSWQCRTCDTIWMHFEHNQNKGFYRLCEHPDNLCNNCRFIDAAIDQQSIVTTER